MAEQQKAQHPKFLEPSPVFTEEEKKKYKLGRDVVRSLEKLKGHTKGLPPRPQMSERENTLEQRYHEKLAQVCRMKPFNSAALNAFPAHIINFFVPYAAIARDRGVRTEFGDAILRYYIRNNPNIAK